MLQHNYVYVIYIVCIIIYCGFQEPEIKSESTGGLKPEKFESDIVFDDIHFRYPARPDVQVRIAYQFIDSPSVLEITSSHWPFSNQNSTFS